MNSQKIAILGYNREGRAALKYFQRQGADCTVFYYTNPKADKTAPIQDLPKDIEVKEIPRDTDFSGLLNDFDLVVRTADILPHRIKTIKPITSNTIEFFAKCPAPIIGVTGTKGKGTTSSLIAEFLKADGKNVHLVGNIGDPPLNHLESVKAQDLVVFELSSFQLTDLKQSPHVAVHLMVEPDHVDVHNGMGDYLAAKANIFKHQKQDDIAVFYAGDERVVKAANDSIATTKIPFDRNSKDQQAARVEQESIFVGDNKLAKVTDVKLRGEHMLDNVCAASAAVINFINDQSVYTKVLKSFAGLPHRLQTVANINGVEYIDDSISSNPATSIAAIKAFKQPKILILGGEDHGADYERLIGEIKDQNIKLIILLGETSDLIEGLMNKAGIGNFKRAKDIIEAVGFAANNATNGDIVLLSPGAKSFDMFANYEDRGNQFTQAVNNLR